MEDSKMKAAYLEWGDALTSNNWFTTHEADMWCQESNWIIKEVGWIVQETKEYIVFSHSWKPADEYTAEQFNGLHKIPKNWIIKRKEIKI